MLSRAVIMREVHSSVLCRKRTNSPSAGRSSSIFLATNPLARISSSGVESAWMAPKPQWWLVNTSPLGLTTTPEQKSPKSTTASFRLTPSGLYSSEGVRVRPSPFMMSAVFWSIRFSIHMPSSACRCKLPAASRAAARIFFICIRCSVLFLLGLFLLGLSSCPSFFIAALVFLHVGVEERQPVFLGIFLSARTGVSSFLATGLFL